MTPTRDNAHDPANNKMKMKTVRGNSVKKKVGALKEKLNSVQVEDYNELNFVVNDNFEEEKKKKKKKKKGTETKT